MSAQDPGAAMGVVPTPPSRCECKHLVSFHALNDKGQRTACSRRGQNPCACKRFVKAGDGRG